MQTRIFVDIYTGEVMGEISFPIGTPEKQWENSLNGIEGVVWDYQFENNLN